MISNSPAVRLIESACASLSLNLSAAQLTALIDYVSMLQKWNQTYNLTAVQGTDNLIKRHVIDTLSIVADVATIKPDKLADIGTGAGIPGIILAIIFADTPVYLVESTGKKCRFLRHVIARLELNPNGKSQRIEVINKRVEHWQPACPIALILCRAFTSLADFTKITAHLGAENSMWLAMKSNDIDAESQALTAPFTIIEQRILNVPFEAAQRRLVKITKTID